MKKILLIRFSAIGDIVLTTPVIRCLRKQFPGAVIHFLTTPQFCKVLENNPYLDEVLSAPHVDESLIRMLSGQAYDLVIDLHKNGKSATIKKKLDTASFSFYKANIPKWLAVNFKWRRSLPDKHIVDRYFEVLQSLDVLYDDEGLDFFIGKDDQVDLTQLPAHFHQGFYIMAPWASFLTKSIPENKAIAFIQALDLPVIIIGGAKEAEYALNITQTCGEKAFSMVGKLNIAESASLIAQSKAVIAVDTGMMHIAAALKKPVLSVWGSTIPEMGMYPFFPASMYSLSKILELKLGCRPCSKLGFDQCPKAHHRCMQGIMPEAVVNGIREITGNKTGNS